MLPGSMQYSNVEAGDPDVLETRVRIPQQTPGAGKVRLPGSMQDSNVEAGDPDVSETSRFERGLVQVAGKVMPKKLLIRPEQLIGVQDVRDRKATSKPKRKTTTLRAPQLSYWAQQKARKAEARSAPKNKNQVELCRGLRHGQCAAALKRKEKDEARSGRTVKSPLAAAYKRMAKAAGSVRADDPMVNKTFYNGMPAPSVGFLLYGAVRSDVMLQVTMASIRTELLDHLRKNSRVTVHASVDCPSSASCDSVGLKHLLEADTLHVEIVPATQAAPTRKSVKGTTHTEAARVARERKTYINALGHALRALNNARAAGAMLAIVSRVDVEYLNRLPEPLMPPRSSHRMPNGEWWPPWIVVSNFGHYHQLNDRFCYGPLGTVAKFLELRYNMTRGGLAYAERGACLAARELQLNVTAAPIKMVRRSHTLNVPLKATESH